MNLLGYLRAFYYLNNLLKHAHWSSQKLEDYQNKQLRNLIQYAYNYVPIYHKQFRELNLKPSDVKTKKDLNKLPIISKNDIRQNLNEMISTEFKIEDLIMLSTSGSTGKPLFLYISDSESMFRKAKHLRANFSCGQKPFDKWVTIIAPHHFNQSSYIQRMIGLFTPTPISVFVEPSKQISMLEHFGPDILDGYSSSLFVLAKEIQSKGINSIRPKSVIGGAELIDAYSRHFIEKIFRTKFYDQYSSVEFERMSWQCHEGEHYHIDADALIMQFVDKDGEEVSAGERGEIVCTSLFNYAMPFVRYSIGDIGVPSDELCNCGRTLPLMKTVEGRKDSLICLPNGRTLTPRTFTIAVNMFRFYNLIDQFRVIQKKKDLFEFLIVLKDESVEMDVIEKEFIAHLEKVLNLEQVRFEIKFVEGIPLDNNGKFMAVVSNLTECTLD